MKNNIYFVFDVESVGLYGSAFAFGICIINSKGELLDEAFLYYADGINLFGSESDRKWVKEHVVPAIEDKAFDNIREEVDSIDNLFESFWYHWSFWKEKGAIAVVDCGFPVETNFLDLVIGSDEERKWKGPYPLIDLSTILFYKGLDPTKSFPRLDSELPAHNPLADARQTGRLLINYLAVK